MPEGTPGGNVFGFFESNPLEGVEEPDEPTASQEETPEPPSAEAPSASEEGAPEETEEEEEEEETGWWAGRYPSREAFEEGYKQLQAAFTRVAQQNKELQERARQQEEFFAQLVPLLQGLLASQDPEFAERLQQVEAIGPLIERQLEPLRRQLAEAQTELLVQRRIAEANEVVSGFFAAHPDVKPGSPEDKQMAAFLRRVGLEASNPEHLEVAYQAIKDPDLALVLAANPVWARSPEGLEFAKFQAAQIKRSERGKRVASKASSFVETGGGAPVPTAPSAKDEFDEALEAYRASKAKSVFGV